MDDDELYSDEEIARMDAIAEKQQMADERENVIKHDREVLRQSLDLLDRLHRAWCQDLGADITDLLDGEVHAFLLAHHPDWASEE